MKRAFLFLTLVIALSFVQSCTETKAGEIEQITVEQMSEALKDSSIQLLDVRTGEEFLTGHLKNSHNICVTDDDFEEKAASLDRDKPVYVYCKKGGRSARAAEILKEMGFKKIYDLKGGIVLWEESGQDTEKEQS
ncbi:rhodanese-like domain-containing protein [Gilvibacter sediminis]|uniref:rhodanese-like domain-containing protein n=1 Tax=Gilvibacter sediminis TaxID=379071 RepID=UPI0023500B02|nr:rhodanese-like domain-containing protein [Gilvibacter sediminis]MDC7998493.1 rhodanese-like domain-containing protein [Gilvibacter sediminis]